MRFFILDENKNVVEVDNFQYLLFLSRSERLRVNKTKVHSSKYGECEVSTVFLAAVLSDDDVVSDFRFFETMVFGGEKDGHTERCQTYAEAEQQHDQVVDALLNGTL